jgi:hypothetical protein
VIGMKNCNPQEKCLSLPFKNDSNEPGKDTYIFTCQSLFDRTGNTHTYASLRYRGFSLSLTPLLSFRLDRVIHRVLLDFGDAAYKAAKAIHEGHINPIESQRTISVTCLPS